MASVVCLLCFGLVCFGYWLGDLGEDGELCVGAKWNGQGLFVGEAGAPGEVVEAAAGVVGAAEDALHHNVVLAGVYAHGACALCGKVRFGHGKDLGGQTLTAKVRGYGQSMDDAVGPGVVPYPG